MTGSLMGNNFFDYNDTLCIFIAVAKSNYFMVSRFNYALNLLITENEEFNLDDLREYLLIYAKDLCLKYFIGTFFRPGVVIEDTTELIDGKIYRRREISLNGQLINTYDWDTIFFKASKTNLIQNFINDYSRNRESRSQTTAR